MTGSPYRSLCSWSGGKDSCFALMQAMKQGHDAAVLLNVLNEEGKISRSHGIPHDILRAQAERAALPVHMISSSWNDYEKKFTSALSKLKQTYHLTHAIFGDIDLQPHRDWEEKVCTNAGLDAVLPLWQQDRKKLVTEMIGSGIETIIVSCNAAMGERFLGKTIDHALVEELEMMGIDACGENGEYHTLVVNCPLFSKPLNVCVTQKLLHEQYWFSGLSLTD